MTTISSKVFRHHRKADGTYNVKICIYHQKERVYIDTAHYVTDKKLTSILTIKDPVLSRLINQTLDDYRETISRVSNKIDFLNARELRDYLISKNEAIDFIKFCQLHIDSLNKNGQKKSAANYRTIRYSLIDYFKKDKVSTDEITLNSIRGYEQYLKSDRTITRTNQFGKLVTTHSRKLSANSISNYLRDFKGLYSAALSFYNNTHSDIVRIKHNPFEHFKIADATQTKKRNITITQVRKIRDCKVISDTSAELARDLFMLSFYLCGINAADLHAGTYQIVGDRIEYNRSKTKGKRKDDAFISIKVIPEAKALLYKYRNLSKRYATSENLNAALSTGMRQISVLTQIPDITYYWARHTFANLARNTCRKSKDDVALALNHVDQARKTTDIYLAKDWSIIDEVQLAVVSLLRKLDKRETALTFRIQHFLFRKYGGLKEMAGSIFAKSP